jgi:eukaryotic-like serine/threonine-protein kinase
MPTACTGCRSVARARWPTPDAAATRRVCTSSPRGRGRVCRGTRCCAARPEGLELARPLLRALGVALPAGPRRTTLALLGLCVRLLWRGPDAALRSRGDDDGAAALRVDLCWSIGRGLSNVIPRLGTMYMLRSVVLAQGLGDPARTARGFAYFGGILPALGPRAARKGEAFLRRADVLGAADPQIRGSTEIWRAFRALLAGEWAAAIAAVDRGLEQLAGVRTDTSWERTVGECFALVALDLRGAWPELQRRAEAGLADARARGDRYAQTVFSQFLAQCRLAAGQPGAARALLAAGAQAWTRDEYTIQHFYALRLEVLLALAEGAHAQADRLLTAAWPQIRRSELLTAPLSRIEVWLLEARVALALAVAGHDTLRRAARATREIGRTDRPDAAAQARLLDACGAACAGRPDAAAFTGGAAALAGHDMGLLATVARRCAAVIGDDPAGVAAADAWLVARGVHSPARWTALYAPCPGA